MIDEIDNDDDIVDYETSEQRILTLAIMLALLLIILATIMTTFLVKQQLKTSFIIYQTSRKKEFRFPLVPHLALLFNDGSMEIYEFSSDNAQLHHRWSFKVPQQEELFPPQLAPNDGHNTRYSNTGYYGYIPGYILSITKGAIFIFYMGGKKDTTVLTTNGKSSNLTHFTIKQSKLPKAILYDSKYSQAGNQVLITGYSEEQIFVNPATNPFFSNVDCDELVLDKVTRKTLIWNLKRQIFYPGPKLPFKAMGKGCPVTLNRTHVLILYINQNNCLDAWMYSFQEFQWNHLNTCFYAPSNSTLSTITGIDVESLLRFDLLCASYLDKYVNRKILVGLKAVENFLCHGEYLKLLLLDLETKSTSIINSNFSKESSKYFVII